MPKLHVLIDLEAPIIAILVHNRKTINYCARWRDFFTEAGLHTSVAGNSRNTSQMSSMNLKSW